MINLWNYLKNIFFQMISFHLQFWTLLLSLEKSSLRFLAYFCKRVEEEVNPKIAKMIPHWKARRGKMKGSEGLTQIISFGNLFLTAWRVLSTEINSCWKIWRSSSCTIVWSWWSFSYFSASSFLSKERKKIYSFTTYKDHNTVFENHPKCRIWVFQFWHFLPVFVQSKLTGLITLFDCKL